jgi:2-polyprenyl-3-methyl-5-hydroxy-6-metoxy-1,4-benzoquinol methylase
MKAGIQAPEVARTVPVTHRHIFTVLRTLLSNGSVLSTDRPLRILDIGCGDGHLIDSVMNLSASEMPGQPIEVYGFDIGEQGYQDGRQKRQAEIFLNGRHPDIHWSDRIKIISHGAPWNYPAGYFDFAVSNQVIEHVHDLAGMLENLNRSVRVGGASIHLFPLRNCIQEAHCLVPFAHWIRNFDMRVAWIALMSRIGVGRYARDRIVLGHRDPDTHARETAKYIQCWTYYRNFDQIADLCNRIGLSVSYHFTKDFFFAKMRSLCKMEPARHYRYWNWFGGEWFSFLIGRYLSSSTLIIGPLAYDIGARIAAEKASKAEASPAPAPIKIAA